MTSAKPPATSMVFVPDHVIETPVEVGTVRIDQQVLRAYARCCGDEATAYTGYETAPVAFALTLLSLRRRTADDVSISPGAFAVHGGHEIEQIEPLRSGRAYVVRSSITGVFEKSGRSGALTVITRRSDVDEANSGARAANITEHQVVRWAQRTPQRERPALQPRRETPATVLDSAPVVGDEIARAVRFCPTREGISTWAAHLNEREALFSDLREARDRGFADLVVPGPMLSAFAAQMLTRALPSWQTQRLSMTFRQSVLAQESIILSAVATEKDDQDRLACDIVIEDAGGETCPIGSASLRHQERNRT